MVLSALSRIRTNAEWDETRDELIRNIRYGSGYQLIFFFTPSTAAAAHVRKGIREFLENEERKELHCYVLSTPQELLALRRGLVEKSRAPKAGCVWIESLDWDGPGNIWGSWQKAWGELFARLNSQRGVLETEFDCPLVIVGPPNAKPVIRQAAPDLWSKRSNTVECSGEAVQVVVTQRSGNEETSAMPRLSEMVEEHDRRLSGVSRSITLIDEAQTHYGVGELNASRDAALEALRGLQEDGNEVYLSSAFAIFALAESDLGNLDSAATSIRMAIELREKSNTQRVPFNWFVTAGIIAYRRKDPERALQWYHQALRAMRSEMATPARREASILAEARIQMRIAEALELQGQRTEAHEATLEALRLSRDLFTADPANADAASALFFILLDVGALVAARGDDVGAIASFRDAVEIARGCVARYDNDRQWRQRLCFALNRLGDALAQGEESPAASSVYEEVLVVRRELLQEKPDDLATMGDLSRSLRKVATSRMSSHDWVGAYTAQTEALGLDEIRIQQDANIDLCEALPDRYALASIVAHELGKQEEALQWARKAVDAATDSCKLSGKTESLAKHRQWLAELEARK